MALVDNAKKQLILDERAVKTAYQDHLGYWTIGIGRLVDKRKPGAGLRDSEMAFMLSNDIEERLTELNKRIPWFKNLSEARQGVLLNMSFQMGVDGLLGFKNTLRMAEQGQYDAAGAGMLNSLWARQTPARANRLSVQMRTGVWQFDKFGSGLTDAFNRRKK